MKKYLYLFLFLLTWSPSTWAQFNYQGQLLLKIVGDDDTFTWEVAYEISVDMTFALYTQATGGVAVWTETHAVTTDDYGIYSVQLGLMFSTPGPYWLGVTVDTNAEMTPRLPIGSVISAHYFASYGPYNAAPALCTGSNAGTLVITSTYHLCICNGTSWRFVGYGTACQW